MEINRVTSQKLIENIPQQMHAIIKAKGNPTKYIRWSVVELASSAGCNLTVETVDPHRSMS